MLTDTAHSTGPGMCCEVQSAIMMACRCVWQEESLEAKCIEGVTRALGRPVHGAMVSSCSQGTDLKIQDSISAASPFSASELPRLRWQLLLSWTWGKVNEESWPGEPGGGALGSRAFRKGHLPLSLLSSSNPSLPFSF